MSFKLSETTQGIKWINHFNGSDKIYAQQLLDGITWISSNEFSSTLRESIEEHAKEFKGPIGLLIERELRRNGHGVQRFYKQKKNPKQAFGAALQPIESKEYSKHQVGSEGIIASLATELSREHSSKFFLHPTVKQLKELKIEAFFILTDTIGSGSQVSTFLDSLWKVATLKSLHSFKRLNFVVISYAVTTEGMQKVESHNSTPTVVYSIQCPTIDSVFNKTEAQEIKDFCSRYSYKQSNEHLGPLGYDNVGALIAYAHGIPNNSPLILHKESKKNIPPLFKSRVTGNTKYEMNNGPLEIDHGKTLERNEQLKLATSKWLKTASREAKDFIVVLASLRKSPRSINAISKRTSLTKENVKRQLKLAQKCDWISEKYRLTDEGGNLLNQLKSNKKNRRKVEWKIDLLYHPDSLRESRF